MPTPRNRIQTTIPNSNIVIDRWEEKQSNGRDPSIRFMTSMNHHTIRTVSHMRKANYLIYTSLFNKWFLHEFYEIPEDRIMVLDPDETMEIYDRNKKEKFKVTAIAANYCAGSSMFFFQGSFGNVLYTGFFRLCSSFQILNCPELKEVVENDRLDVAYVDNSYADERCNFPSRIEMIKLIIERIRSGGNCKIVISSKRWGKEEVLLAIASKLDEKIDVGVQRYSIFEKLGVAEFFTRQSKETRIRAMDHLLTHKECQKMMKRDKTVIIILMTAIYEYGDLKVPSMCNRLFIIPYSGHCNHTELKEFVGTIKPHSVLPVLLPKVSRACSIIPKSITDLCTRVEESSSGVNAEASVVKKSDPRVVLTRLQVSPLRLKRINGSYLQASSITPAERRTTRSPVPARSCPCASGEASSKDTSEVSAESANTSSSCPTTRLSSNSTLTAENGSSLEKSTSSTRSPRQLLSSSTPLLANVSAAKQQKSENSLNMSCSSHHLPVISSPSSPVASASVSAVKERRSPANSASHDHSYQSSEVNASVVESVQPVNEECPAEGHVIGDGNEQGVVDLPNDLVDGAVPNLNDVVTPRHEIEYDDPFSQNEMAVASIYQSCSSHNLVTGGAENLSEAVTPPLREIRSRELLSMSRTDVENMSESEDRNPTTFSSVENCLIRAESPNVLSGSVSRIDQNEDDIIDEMPLAFRFRPANVCDVPKDCRDERLGFVSPRVDRNEESIVDERPLTLRLQSADLQNIREDCRNVLLGSTFPHIFQRENVEEMPLASSLVSEAASRESDCVVEETVPSTGDICLSKEANLPSSEPSNAEAMEPDSADSSKDVVNASDIEPMCETISDTPGTESTTANEPPPSINSTSSSPERGANITSKSCDNQRITFAKEDVISAPVTNTNHQSLTSKTRPVRKKRSHSEDDITPFELDERVAGRAKVSAPQNTGTIAGNATRASVEDDCYVLEVSRGVNNACHSQSRAVPNGRVGGSVDADQSDSDDCMVVGEYMGGAEPAYEPFGRASKRSRLDPMYRPRRNDESVNAIVFHYMKTFPQEMRKLAFQH